MDGGRFALIILGGVHDLADNLERLSGGQGEYVRVATTGWREFAENVGGGSVAGRLRFFSPLSAGEMAKAQAEPPQRAVCAVLACCSCLSAPL